jgi:hypothetical protein
LRFAFFNDISLTYQKKKKKKKYHKLCFLLFPISVGVANRLDKLQRDFLWGGIGDEAKFYLVNWNRIYTPLKLGGLGVYNFI